MKPIKGMLGPTDSNAPELTEAQKEVILRWREPLMTTSAECRHCRKVYSLGYLRLCGEKPDWFCEPFVMEPFLGEPMSDQMMGEEFGTTREQLEKSDITKEEAAEILEDVLDTLIESGNGATQEDLSNATDKLFKFRDRWFDKQ